jgi:cysteine synthase
MKESEMLRLYGAELIEVEDGNFDGAIQLRDNLAKEFGYFNPNQFSKSSEYTSS